MRKSLLFIISFLFLTAVFSFQQIGSIYASGNGGKCDEASFQRWISDYAKCESEWTNALHINLPGPLGANKKRICQDSLCDTGLECVKSICQPVSNAPVFMCKCINGPTVTGDGQNGFRCGPDVNNIPTSGEAAYCGNSSEACVKSGDITGNDIVPQTIEGLHGAPVPYPNNVHLRGVACTDIRPIAKCRCDASNGGTDKKNGFSCDMSDTPGQKGTGFCSDSNFTCINTTDPEELIKPGTTKDYGGAFKNANGDQKDYDIRGVKCENPPTKCKCNTPGRGGNRQNGFTCHQCTGGTGPNCVGGKDLKDVDYCPEVELGCVDDPAGQVTNSENQIFSGAPLKEVKCVPVGISPPPPPPCAEALNAADGKCLSFNSALGPISTDAGSFLTSLFALLLSISGGIALLLIIKAGYMLMTSTGKPDKVQAGRDQLVAAIVGLLFIIFSFVILQVIGVDILHLPEFTKGTIPAGGTCNPNNNQCAGGYQCNYNGGSTGQCVPPATGSSCNPNNGSNDCPTGQTCVYQGSSTGQCQ